jgi:glucose/arabinose dehydrogenase
VPGGAPTTGGAGRSACAAAAALLTLALGAWTAGPVSGAGGYLQLRKVASLERPVHVAQPPGHPELLFVVQQAGRIAVVRRGEALPQPFLDLHRRVRFEEEAGMLSIAFDPDYAHNRRSYVDYVNSAGNVEVDAFVTSRRDPARARRGSRSKVIEIPHPDAPHHYGGTVTFGPDGMLYLGTGDGGVEGDPDENAENPGSLLGKILRIDPRPEGGYRAPSSNPFADGGGAPEVYSLGLRNPFRFSFDRNGDLAIGDVGQSLWEEIDYLPLDAAAGANFGWDTLEGNHPNEAPFVPPPNYVAPIHEYSSGPLTNACSVIGGYVARDPQLPALRRRYLYADACSGEIRSLEPRAADPTSTDAPTGLEIDFPVSFGEDDAHHLYVVSVEGDVFRLVERP